MDEAKLLLDKGGFGITGALKILVLPKKKGGVGPLEQAIPQNPDLGAAIRGVMAAPILLHTTLVNTGSAAIRATCYKGTKPEVKWAGMSHLTSSTMYIITVLYHFNVSKYLEQML